MADLCHGELPAHTIVFLTGADIPEMTKLKISRHGIFEEDCEFEEMSMILVKYDHHTDFSSRTLIK